MASRLNLHAILVSLLGNTNVYFQPPASLQMAYPCIVYSLNDVDTKYADDGLYLYEREYSVTVIDKNPDTETPFKILKLPKCAFERSYISDNLNHYVLRLYY